MHIKVMYLDGKIGSIESYQLDALISSKRIKKFQRSGRWVTIGIDPMRQIKADYPHVTAKKRVSRKPERK
jgi:hypothetical protein